MKRSAPAAQNDELKAFAELAHSFAGKELKGHTEEYEYPYSRDVSGVMAAAVEAGLFGINLPLDWGGVGLDATALAGIVEEISTIDAGMAAMLFTHAAALEIIAAAAEQDKDSCRSIFGLIALPEGVPLAFQSYAAPDELDLPLVTGDSTHLLTGFLPLLALGDKARYAVAAAARENEGGYSWYLIDLKGEGVAPSAPLITLGLQACRTVDVILNDAKALLIGDEGKGAACFKIMQSHMSVPAAAISLGIMRGCFREALDYAGQRWQGGRNIVEWSGVRMKLAEIAIQIDVAASCLSGICSAADAAQADSNRSALAAVIHISDLACTATTEGVQLLGGNGYMKDYGQEKRMRDARQARSLLGMSGMKKMSYIDEIIKEANI